MTSNDILFRYKLYWYHAQTPTPIIDRLVFNKIKVKLIFHLVSYYNTSSRVLCLSLNIHFSKVKISFETTGTATRTIKATFDIKSTGYLLKIGDIFSIIELIFFFRLCSAEK